MPEEESNHGEDLRVPLIESSGIGAPKHPPFAYESSSSGVPKYPGYLPPQSRKRKIHDADEEPASIIR